MPRLSCLCGKREATPVGQKDGIEMVECLCGIVRRAEVDPQDYIAQYMTGGYHNEHIATVVGQPIKDRFEHDYQVAKLRLAELQDWRHPVSSTSRIPCRVLDVGCGNGAFVQAA